MEAIIQEVRGFVANRNVRKFNCYLSPEELGATQVKAGAEGLSVSRLAREVVQAFIKSGFSLEEYKEQMQEYQLKRKANKK